MLEIGFFSMEIHVGSRGVMKIPGNLLFLLVISLFMAVFNATVFGADRTVTFSTSDSGQSKNITHWGYDRGWVYQVPRSVIFMGDALNCVRVPCAQDSELTNGSTIWDSELSDTDKSYLQGKLNAIVADGGADLKWYLYCDNIESDWYISGQDRVYPDRLAALFSANVRYLSLLSNTPDIDWLDLANEPDLQPGRQGSPQDYYDALGYMQSRSEFSGMLTGGLGVLNSDVVFDWFDPIRSRAALGSTHNLAGACSEYVAFLHSCNSIETFEPEVHNVGECIVGAEYGLDGVIWWGTAGRARGEFAQACRFGKRLGYAEHLPNWTAAAVYRHADGRVQGFVGEQERQARPTTYEFYCADRPVFFDGHGPQRSYTVATSGGDGYQTSNHKNAERVINITWGDDVQPPITDGRYVLVNRNSSKVMEVASASTSNGANIRQNTYTGGTHQQWDIESLNSYSGGDWSHFKVTVVHSGKCADVFNFSYNNGGNIAQWDMAGTAGGENQQWYFDYIEDGWFYIRSRWNKKCLDVEGASISDGANIRQWDSVGGYNQMWRLLPVGTAIEFVAPAVPTGVTATANATSVDLTWNANSESDLAGYTVLRSTTSDGPYDIVGRGITGTSFTDNEATQTIPYYYVVKAVDESLNRSANSSQVSATPQIGGASGTILRQWWTGITGTAVTDLTSNANYPNNPTGSEQLISLEGLTDWADNYGTRIRGYIHPPTSGNYTFWVAGDDNCELYLSTDSNPANATLIANVPGWTNSREWTKYFEQQSLSITLTGGQMYYIEVLQKEGTGGDNLAVAWQGPGLSQQIIDGSYLSPWGVPLFIVDPVTEIDAIELKAYNSTIADDASDPESDPMTFSKVSGPNWLTVAPDGALSGIPRDVNIGENSFTVSVTDGTGFYDTATMTIQVANTYSGTQGMTDLLGFAAQWLMLDCVDAPACDGADLDGDDDVTVSDFSVLAHNWLGDEAMQLHLKFDETSGDTAYDSSIYWRPGTLVNAPTWDLGYSGNALSFDGTNDHVEVSGYQGIPGGGSRTCMAWIKTASVSGEILTWGEEYNGGRWVIRVNEGGQLRAEVQGGNIIGTTVINNNTWHHVAVVVADDGSPDIAEAQLYVDGQLETISSFADEPINSGSAEDVKIGAYLAAGGPRYFQGLIDEVRIYDTALTQQEIQAIASQ